MNGQMILSLGAETLPLERPETGLHNLDGITVQRAPQQCKKTGKCFITQHRIDRPRIKNRLNLTHGLQAPIFQGISLTFGFGLRLGNCFERALGSSFGHLVPVGCNTSLSSRQLGQPHIKHIREGMKLAAGRV